MLERNDFSFREESEYGKFVAYHERTSKNGKATMSKFQTEHFRPVVKVYEPDVVETFERYFLHLLEGMYEFFLGVIDNPRTMTWYLRAAMGERSLSYLVKRIFEENGLDPDDYTNKSGRTTLVTRMGEAGVPPEVRILVRGHNSEKAYGRYGRSKEAKVRVAQRCASDASLTYVKALEEETATLKATMVDGMADESPPKRLKILEDKDVSSTRDSIALKFTSLEIDTSPLPMQDGSGPSGLIAKNLKGKRVRKLEDVEDLVD